MHLALIGEGGFVLLGLLFYLWMIVECVRREKGMERVMWLLLVVFVPDLGSLIYFFVRVVKVGG
jgi:uncharacterized membrane protein YhaH (DUF805 family)